MRGALPLCPMNRKEMPCLRTRHSRHSPFLFTVQRELMEAHNVKYRDGEVVVEEVQ